VSVIMSTYNRGELLDGAVRSVLAQRVDITPPFELIVVDNNSTDRTRDIVERFAGEDGRVRYLFEPQQGLSFARNAGVREARAPLIAFTDDDVRAEPDWVAAIVRAFSEYPEADMVGGRVLPVWPAAPPVWLTRDHWTPLALVDYGEAAVSVSADHPICLVGANLSLRRSVFDTVGVFATKLQRVKDSVGSLEDYELLLRVLRVGRKAIYDPRIMLHAQIQPNRLERAYHRRWHTGHGHFHALLRSDHMEQTSVGSLFGVPGHLYRQALGDLAGWVRATASGEQARAFHHDVRLRFFHGFFRTRWREFREKSGPERKEGLRRLVHAVRDLDTRWHRRQWPHVRDVVFDARTAMEYAMMAPVHRRLLADPRVRTWLMSSERPGRAGEIFRDAPRDAPTLSPRQAMRKRFDAYVAADLVWATLPRGTRRVQMFHGVAGKWSRVYDRPTSSMRRWDRLFFINRRRLQNYIASGSIESGSSAIRLVGMPKSDCLVDGSLTRDGVLEANGMDPARTTVLYAPTWTRFSSLNAIGEDVIGGLVDAGYRVLVKLHENSLDRAFENSGGVDWVARLEPILARGYGHLIRSGDVSPWLVAADVLVTDHSSVGFEYLLLDRPLIRISMPELLARADVAKEYVDLIGPASTTVQTAAGVVPAVERALADPAQLSSARRASAAELFHDPGKATDRAVHELYALMELHEPACVPSAAPVHAVTYTAERALSR
jgi:glycosyltransferase involved in cell wall biosynthesis